MSTFTLVDGGLSTALAELGEQAGGPLWTAAALLDRPEVLVAAHRRFVDAGADVIITASYQASEEGFVAAGMTPADARRLLALTTDLARRAGARIVAASVSPYGAVLADRSEYTGRYTASWADVRNFHRRRLEVLVDSGPDMFAIETQPTRVEAEIVVEELRALTDAPAWVTFTCADSLRTHGGDPFPDAVAAVASSVQAVGVNCTAAEDVGALMAAAGVDLPLVAYPNGAEGGLVRFVEGWLAAGVRYIGGCCGVGSEEIAELNRHRVGA